MKYKILTKEQIIISLDRLTRFKNTREKYLRVYSDILISNLIEPKFKKSDIETIDFETITNYVTEIFNASLKYETNNIYINKFIKEYENDLFVNDENTQKLLDNNINYYAVLELISDESPVNLKWLKEVILTLDAFKHHVTLESKPEINCILNKLRKEKLLKFPIEKVVLVEGITEEILLPVFSQFLGHDFYANGIQIIAAGGKNQVVKKYYELSQELRVPIFVLLDKDAEENINQIVPKLRKSDKIHLVSCGEFEDLLPKKLVLKTVNEHFKNFLKITEFDLISDLPTAKVLEELFKTKGLHEYKKAEFAKLVRDKITCKEDVSIEIKTIIEEITSICDIVA